MFDGPSKMWKRQFLYTYVPTYLQNRENQPKKMKSERTAMKMPKKPMTTV